MKRIALVAALLGSVGTATPVIAAPLFYNFTSTDPNRASYSFNIDSNPAATRDGSGFKASALNFIQQGSNIPTTETATFFSAQALGGIGVSSFSYFGPQLFTGANNNPTLLIGNFTLFSNSARTNAVGSLSVTDVTAAIPEPATWAMMLVGFAMVGAASRYRRRHSTVRYA